MSFIRNILCPKLDHEFSKQTKDNVIPPTSVQKDVQSEGKVGKRKEEKCWSSKGRRKLMTFLFFVYNK